jgi:hypothetical protein
MDDVPWVLPRRVAWVEARVLFERTSRRDVRTTHICFEMSTRKVEIPTCVFTALYIVAKYGSPGAEPAGRVNEVFTALLSSNKGEVHAP